MTTMRILLGDIDSGAMRCLEDFSALREEIRAVAPPSLFQAVERAAGPKKNTAPLAEAVCLYSLKSKAFLTAEPRLVAGKRLVVSSTNLKPSEMFGPEFSSALVSAGRLLSCDLIQLYCRPRALERRKAAFPKGFYIGNYVYEAAPRPGRPNTDQRFERVSFNSEGELTTFAEIDFLVRREFPGSTVDSLDQMAMISDEYRAVGELSRKGIYYGLRLARRKRGPYALWLENHKSRTALVAMLWVPPEDRGAGTAAEMLQAVRRQTAGRVDAIRYFVSALNISAQKSLLKAGFSLKDVVVNFRLERER